MREPSPPTSNRLAARRRAGGVDAARPRRGRDGVVHHRRVGDLHDFRRGLSLLSRKEPDRTDSARRARGADLLHDLPALQQRDDSSGRKASRAQRVARPSCVLWLITIALGSHLHVRHGAGMAPIDLRTRPDDFHESVRHDVLLARRPARVSRHARTRHAHDRLAAERRRPVRARSPDESMCCRSTGTSSTWCGLSCSPWSTSSGAERKTWPTDETTAIDVPAPTAWPLVLAMGVTLMFAGLLTNMSVTVLGAVLSLAGCVGWFREVVPGDHEEEVPLVADDGEVTNRTSRRRSAGDRARTGPRVASRPHLSGLRGREGRVGRKRRDGGARPVATVC